MLAAQLWLSKAPRGQTEAGVSGGAARGLLRITEVKGEATNSTKKNCWLSSALKFHYSWMEHSLSKISFTKQAFQTIVKTIWQSEELWFALLLDSPETDSCCSYWCNALTSGTALTALLVASQWLTSSQILSRSSRFLKYYLGNTASKCFTLNKNQYKQIYHKP